MAGLTYYFMPIDLYVTAAAGFGGPLLQVADEDRDSHGGVGFAFNLDVGKEWWVSDQWGLGVAGRLWFDEGGTSRKKDEGYAEADFSMIAFALLFSATYQ